MKLSIAFGVCVGSLSAVAQAPKTNRKKVSGWVKAVVVTDGAAVYQGPDFDSTVQEYLPYQTLVMASKKAYIGVGGLGLFHKISYKGKTGFITDTDIRVAKATRGKESSREDSATESESGSKAWEKEEDENLGKAPLFFRRYLGGAAALVNFTEKFSGRKLSDPMLMYGLRMSGPGTLFDGPPLDFNFWFSLDKPGYYSQFASGEPTGLVLFGDIMAQLPMIDLDNTLVTYGIGLMWAYTRYKVPVKNVSLDSEELRIGADVGFGVGQKFGKYMLRGDIKYYIEATQYLGATLSFQTEY